MTMRLLVHVGVHVTNSDFRGDGQLLLEARAYLVRREIASLHVSRRMLPVANKRGVEMARPTQNGAIHRVRSRRLRHARIPAQIRATTTWELNTFQTFPCRT